MDFAKMKLSNGVNSEAFRNRSKCVNGETVYREMPRAPPSSKWRAPAGGVDSTQSSENCRTKKVKRNGETSPKHSYFVRLRPGNYQLSVHLSSKQKPACVTIVPESTNGDSASAPDHYHRHRQQPSKGPQQQPQQPLIYESDSPASSPSHISSSSSSSPSSSFPRKIVNRLFPSSGGKGSSLHTKSGASTPSRKRPGGCLENRGRHCQLKSKYRVAERKKGEGNEFYKKKHYREAIKLYSEAIELCPECASYYSNRSACHMMMAKYMQALSDAREAVRLDSSFVKGYIRVAKCNIALGDANAALSVLRQATDLEPGNKTVRDEVTNATAIIRVGEEVEKAIAKKDYRTAIYHIDRALELAVGCRALKITKAEYLVYLERHPEAQEIVNEILQYDSGNVDAICVRGMCLYYQDNQEAAFTHFQHVLKLAPDHKKAKEMYKKAKLLRVKKEDGNQAFNKGNLREALLLYTEALSIDLNNKTTNSKLYCNRAAVKVKLGKCEEAVDDCTAAINLNDKYVKAYLRRAKCYQDLEKHEDAVRDYERVCKLDRNQDYTRLLHDAKVQLKCSKRKDYYKILGVSRNATEDDIKKSYKKMALQHHPDRHANASDKEKQDHEVKFKEIGEAYAVLTDAKKRAMYDRGQDINDPDYGFGQDDVDPNQIFQAFFSSGGSNFSFQQQGFGSGFQSGFGGGGGGGGGFPGGFHFQFG